MAELEPLYDAAEMKAAEAGHDVDELMGLAGRAVAGEVLRAFPDARSILAVCGGGANGGDGRIAVEALRGAGRDASEGVDVGGADVILDALFGTGFRGEPRREAADLIGRINGAAAPVLSVDLPSGVDASTGEVAGEAVRADITVTFHGPKVGLAVAPGRFHAGTVTVADIGLERRDTAVRLVTRALLRRVPRRAAYDTKYTAGSLLVVGGSRGLTGAACLAAEAAFRADAGYVAVAAPEESLPVIETRLLEAVKRPLSAVFEAAERASAVALGPGLGRSDEARELVDRVLRELERPVVVDADALHGLKPIGRSAPTVLTPHAGELARLLGEASEWVDAHRLEAAQRGAERFRAVCVLKGADSIIAAPDRPPLVCALGSPALATAGTGDVLTGVCGAFLAKGLEAREAAAAAVAAQQVASTLVPNQTGMVASDVIAALPRALDASL
ncbi:MAG TPA: NAD(P)H-hydrate dehydratase [Gaiellaceae bacterium]|nr:NAD(P)H-hydrate dehydratase [Gaiellaceae bacterium]